MYMISRKHLYNIHCRQHEVETKKRKITSKLSLGQVLENSVSVVRINLAKELIVYRKSRNDSFNTLEISFPIRSLQKNRKKGLELFGACLTEKLK